jgi:hypothetical protein
VIVNENDRGRVRQDDRLEDLARMDEGGGQRADRHGVEAEDLIAAVQEEHHEHLAIEATELLAECRVDLSGVGDPADRAVPVPALSNDA